MNGEKHTKIEGELGRYYDVVKVAPKAASSKARNLAAKQRLCRSIRFAKVRGANGEFVELLCVSFLGRGREGGSYLAWAVYSVATAKRLNDPVGGSLDSELVWVAMHLERGTLVA